MDNEVDLAGMIPDHYYCNLCNQMYVGVMCWAAHTAQVHHKYFRDFERKYGYKKYYYGKTLQEDIKGEEEIWNPSKREGKE